jgi:exo-1,4-beta-D-glucosaminidase
MRMQITGRGDEEALPILWEDNYVTLLPGETRTISATYRTRDLGGSPPRLVVTGWNVHRTIAR